MADRVYFGAFGGAIASDSTRITQTGTVFFPDIDGGPMDVNAQGDSNSTASAFGGVQFGYEWTQYPFITGFSDWIVTPTLEIEGYWYNHTKKGHLINPTDRIPEHDFASSFPMDVAVDLLNGVLTMRSAFGRVAPYIAGGIGAARLRIRNAVSLQTSPPEPDINHFNSKPKNATWAFAAQIKAGLNYYVYDRVHLFAEYRCLYIDSSAYKLGPTDYPDHAATSSWKIHMKNIYYNAFALGVQFDL
ncbi:MAG: outer membrane beta-barrel protein [Chlamydiales bacterium]|nr:outer membrane beta-barrel protein [Chlamydiales bacterium]